MSRLLPIQLRSAIRDTGNLLLWLTAVLVILYVLSGLYSVANNEIGVLLRFGKVIDPNVAPGIHYALPWPVDRVHKVPMPKVEKISIADFSQGHAPITQMGVGSYAITGDNNLVNLECVIQYEISDPEDYLFNLEAGMEDVEATARSFLREMACISILHCLGRMNVDDVLTSWEQIVTDVRKNLQFRLDDIESGLSITFVEIKGLQPPSKVQRYFDGVTSAKHDKRRAISDAESYRNERTLAARGQAARTSAAADAYRNETVHAAEGDARRFLSRLSEYHRDREGTRQRLYLEAVREVLGAVGQSYVVDASDGRQPATIKLLQGTRDARDR